MHIKCLGSLQTFFNRELDRTNTCLAGSQYARDGCQVDTEDSPTCDKRSKVNKKSSAIFIAIAKKLIPR